MDILTIATSPWFRDLAGIILYLVFVFAYRRLFGNRGLVLLVVSSVVLFSLFVLNPISQLIASILIVAFAVGAEITARRRPRYQAAKVLLEGQFIRRGLTPPEAAVILERPFKTTARLIVLGLIKKEITEVKSYSPFIVEVAEDLRTRGRDLSGQEKTVYRQKQAAKLDQIITPFEDQALEVLEANGGKPLAEIDFTIIEKSMVAHTFERMQGHELEQTRAYYTKLVQRAQVEIRSATGKNLRGQNAVDWNYEWVLLDETVDATTLNGNLPLPSWLQSDNRSG
ncbi:MAG: hypothetical protein JXB38_07205 [Anaerolineales bacterium]|nr:hypothetical protein [Anaerolineales bacterium]